MTEAEKLRLLVDISKMYYQDNYSQLEISKRVNLSRTYVSKLLEEAKQRGIVTITINDPFLSQSETEKEKALRAKYNLKKVIIVPTKDNDTELNQKLGAAAAEYFNTIVKSNDIISASWGSTLYSFSKCVIPRTDLENIQISQLSGGISRIKKNIFTYEIPQNIAAALNADFCVVPAPPILSDREIRDALQDDPIVSKGLRLAKQSTIAIFTVGVFDHFSAFVRAGYFSEKELQELKKLGAVGDICSHVINSQGQLCDTALENRTLALPYEDIISIPTRICIAANMVKYECVKAALHGSCFNVFVTNQTMADKLLEEE